MPQFHRYYGILHRNLDARGGATPGTNKTMDHDLRQKRNQFASARNPKKLRVRFSGTSFENDSLDKHSVHTLTSGPPCPGNIIKNGYNLNYERTEYGRGPKSFVVQATLDVNGNPPVSIRTSSMDNDCVPVVKVVKTAEDVYVKIPNSADRRSGRRHSETSIYSSGGVCVSVTLLRATRSSGTDGKRPRNSSNNTERVHSDNDNRNTNFVVGKDCIVKNQCRSESYACTRDSNQDSLPKVLPRIHCQNKRDCEAEEGEDYVVCNNVRNHCSETQPNYAHEEQSQHSVYPVRATRANNNAQEAFHKDDEVNCPRPYTQDSAEGKRDVLKKLISTNRKDQETKSTRVTFKSTENHLPAFTTQRTRPTPETSPGRYLKASAVSGAPYKSASVVSGSPTNEEQLQRTTVTPGLPRPPPPCAGHEIFVKIILLGDYGVGKTHLIEALHHATKSDEGKCGFHCTGFRSNEFVELTTRVGGKSVRVKIMDTAGLERFRSMTSSYFRGAQGCIFVFNMTMKDSFNNVIQWHTNMNEYMDIENTLLLGVTTLAQSRDARVVTSERAFRLAEGIRTRYLEASMAEEDLLLAGVSRMVDRVMTQLTALSNKAAAMVTISPSMESTSKKRITCCTS